VSADSGTSTSDGITNDTTLILSGTAEANSTVTLTRSGRAGPLARRRPWLRRVDVRLHREPLADGIYVFNASAIDTAGNASANLG